jgi:hypothetical protein
MHLTEIYGTYCPSATRKLKEGFATIKHIFQNHYQTAFPESFIKYCRSVCQQIPEVTFATLFNCVGPTQTVSDYASNKLSNLWLKNTFCFPVQFS